MIMTAALILAIGSSYGYIKNLIPPAFHKYDEIIKKYSTLNGVEYILVKAHIMAESSFRANAKRDEGKGRISGGLMQILYPTTALALEPTISFNDLYDPDTNIRLGTKLMRELKDRYPSIKDRIVSYNSGRPKFKSNGSYINEEYLRKVTLYNLIFQVGEYI